MNAIIDFLSAPGVLPFSGALIGMVGILVIELLLLAVAGLHLDSLLPDFDFDGDIDADLDVETGVPHDFHLGEWANSWLHVGKVPMVVLLSLALGGFASGGFLSQALAQSLSGSMLSLWVVVPLALLFALFMVRHAARFFGRLMPKDETSVVSAEQFLGQVAVINQGTARFDMPAEAKLVDAHGQAHFIHVKPESEDEAFAEGTSVLLIQRDGYLFTAIRSDVGAHAPASNPT